MPVETLPSATETGAELGLESLSAVQIGVGIVIAAGIFYFGGKLAKKAGIS